MELLTRLDVSQRATVLQLPATPRRQNRKDRFIGLIGRRPANGGTAISSTTAVALLNPFRLTSTTALPVSISTVPGGALAQMSATAAHMAFPFPSIRLRSGRMRRLRRRHCQEIAKIDQRVFLRLPRIGLVRFFPRFIESLDRLSDPIDQFLGEKPP